MLPEENLELLRPSDGFRFKPVSFAIVSLLIVLFLYQIVGGGVTLLIFGTNPGSYQAFGFRLATMLGEILLILVPTLILAKAQTRNWKAFLRIRGADPYFIGLAVVGTVALQQILEVYTYLQDLIPLPQNVRDFVDSYQHAIDQTYRILISTHGLTGLLVIIVVVAVTPAICEETLFRGLVQSSFEARTGKWGAVVWTGLIFGTYHLEPVAFIALSAIGIYLGYLGSATGSILPPIVAHFTNNLLSVLVFYYSGRDTLLAGSGDKSVDAVSIIIWTLVSCVIFIATLTLMERRRKKLQEIIPQ